MHSRDTLLSTADLTIIPYAASGRDTAHVEQIETQPAPSCHVQPSRLVLSMRLLHQR